MFHPILPNAKHPTGDEIKTLREQIRFTQEQLGDVIGLPARRVSEYENEHVRMSPAMWVALLLSVGMHPDLEVRRKKRGA